MSGENFEPHILSLSLSLSLSLYIYIYDLISDKSIEKASLYCTSLIGNNNGFPSLI